VLNNQFWVPKNSSSIPLYVVEGTYQQAILMDIYFRSAVLTYTLFLTTFIEKGDVEYYLSDLDWKT